MKKLSQVAAVATLGLACAMPVMAQSSATSTDTTASTTAPSSTVSTTPSTTSMGAGPSDMNRATDNDNDRDMGWIGLLGLAGLLGLRRKHVDHDRHDHVRTTTAR